MWHIDDGVLLQTPQRYQKSSMNCQIGQAEAAETLHIPEIDENL